MERKHYLSLLVSICLLMTSCATGGGEGEYYDFLNDVTPRYSSYGIGGEGGPGGGTSSGTGGNTQAGIVTAGEWRDLEHWIFWAGLMQGDEFGDKSDYWNFFTNNRVAVKVTKPNGQPAAGVAVELLHNGKVQWQAITDNHGEAECWIGLYQPVTTTSEELTLTLDGQLMEGHPALCKWESTTTQIAVNHYTITSPAVETQQADIAFIVDATGSMGDEINFLKSDLLDIIDKVSAVHPETTIRTAALFSRDEDDECGDDGLCQQCHPFVLYSQRAYDRRFQQACYEDAIDDERDVVSYEQCRYEAVGMFEECGGQSGAEGALCPLHFEAELVARYEGDFHSREESGEGQDEHNIDDECCHCRWMDDGIGLLGARTTTESFLAVSSVGAAGVGCSLSDSDTGVNPEDDVMW